MMDTKFPTEQDRLPHQVLIEQAQQQEQALRAEKSTIFALIEDKRK